MADENTQKVGVKFYRTQDGYFIINIDDISFMKFNDVYDEENNFNPRTSFFEVYMTGNSNSLRLSYRDGIQIMNIMMTEKYGLYHDGYHNIKFTKDNFDIPMLCDNAISYMGELTFLDIINDSSNSNWKGNTINTTSEGSGSSED